jgi:hypothetical protein
MAFLDTFALFRGGSAAVAQDMAHAMATVISKVTGDLNMTIKVLDAKIESAQQKVDTIERELGGLALDAHAENGTTDAAAKLRKANANLDVARRELVDLQTARNEAVARQAAREAEVAALKQEERRQLAVATHRALTASAKKVDRAAEALAEAIAELKANGTELHIVTGSSQTSQALMYLYGALVPVVNHATGLGKNAFLDAKRQRLIDYTPSLGQLGLEK